MKKKKAITRKEFIKRTSAGVVGAGLFLNTTPTSGMPSGIEKRVLGRTGLEVTPVGFGASRTQEPALLLAAIDAGINFIDTGRSYANGQNEVMVGKTIKHIRKELIIQSKVRIRLQESGDALKSEKVHDQIGEIMAASLDESLTALQTDYIDIWLVHGASDVEVLHHEAVLSFFEKAKKAGKIRACGFSTHDNQVPLLKAANEKWFYDVYMVTYNYKGAYIHSNTGHHASYDQEGVENALKKAFQENIGIVGMKTCSAGPYAPDAGSKPTFGKAVQWVTDRPFVHTSAVAMANFDQIQEDTEFLKTV
jgi:aryl-alcohol dehydrogenase-like predicted oxidoreductase